MKALVYVNETERFYMACVTAEQRVDVRKTMKLFSISSLRLADKQTIEKSLGIPLGALSPLTVPCYVPICVDKNVFEQQIVYMGSGSRTISVILKPEYLRNLDNVVVADIKEAP
jgi:prolyl-tRNA editing enzyme YbaK/EbsC (Cys-tRNA(Pro) deacylase)